MPPGRAAQALPRFLRTLKGGSIHAGIAVKVGQLADRL
jgi:hypothetical protein